VQAVCPAPVSVCVPQAIVAAAEFCAASSVTDCATLPAAEMEAVVLEGIAAALIVNVALVMPVPMVTVVGMVRLADDESKDTDVLACAGLFSVRVQVPVPGVWMAVGLQTNVAFSGWYTFRIAVRETVVVVAVIVSLIFPASFAALAVKVALLLPICTVTEPGTATLALLLASVTPTVDPEAVLLRVTEQVLELPCAMFDGLQLTDATLADVRTLIGNVVTAPFIVALNMAVKSVTGLPAVAEKLTLLDPAGTRTLAGTVTATLSLFSETVRPPTGAFPVRLTTQLAEEVVAMAPGEQVRLASAAPPGWSVRVVDCGAPEELADTIGVWGLDTASVLTAKFAFNRPAGTVT
jgi:hypothetical protein